MQTFQEKKRQRATGKKAHIYAIRDRTVRFNKFQACFLQVAHPQLFMSAMRKRLRVSMRGRRLMLPMEREDEVNVAN